MKRVIRNKFGSPKEIMIFCTAAYDATNVVVESLRIAGTDSREQLRGTLAKVRAHHPGI